MYGIFSRRIIRAAPRTLQARTFISESRDSVTLRANRNIPDSTFHNILQPSGVTYYVDIHKMPGGSFNAKTQQVTYTSLLSDEDTPGHYEHEMCHAAVMETARKMPGYTAASGTRGFRWANEILANMLQMAKTNRGVITPNTADLQQALKKLNRHYRGTEEYGEPTLDETINMFKCGYFDPVITHLKGISRDELTAALPKCFQLGIGTSNTKTTAGNCEGQHRADE